MPTAPSKWPQKYHELLLDPATPYWARRLLTEIAGKDPVDVANVLEVILEIVCEIAEERLATVQAEGDLI